MRRPNYTRPINSVLLNDAHIIIPNKCADSFITLPEKIGLKKIKIILKISKTREYEYLCSIRRTTSGSKRVTRIIIADNELLVKLKKIFISSYAYIQNSIINGTHKKNMHIGETIRITCIRKNHSFSFQPVNIKQNPLKHLLHKMADSKYFFEENLTDVIKLSSNWKIAKTNYIKDKRFHRHDISVYYIANTKTKEIYIGKCINGLRPEWDGKNNVGKEHEGMKKGWDIYRFDIIDQEYVHLLSQIEKSMIISFRKLLNKSLFGYTIVNIDYCN